MIVPIGFGTGVMQDGMVVISIPYQLLPGLVDSLEKKNWVPKWMALSRDDLHKEADRIVKEVEVELGEKCELRFV